MKYRFFKKEDFSIMEMISILIIALAMPFIWYFLMTMRINEDIKSEKYEQVKIIRELEKENIELSNENRRIATLEREKERIEREKDRTEREIREIREENNEIVTAQVDFKENVEKELQECALLKERERELKLVLSGWKDRIHEIEVELATQK